MDPKTRSNPGRELPTCRSAQEPAWWWALAAGGRACQHRPARSLHLITDGTGIPLAFSLTDGNCNDVTQRIPLLEVVPPVRGKCGRPADAPT